jgi:hypothetical protein
MSMPRPTRCSSSFARGKKVKDTQIPMIRQRPTAGPRECGKRDGSGEAAGRRAHRPEDPDGTRSHGYTHPRATTYTDEWRAYGQVDRNHRTVQHGLKEWARDDDGVGSGRFT